MNLIEVNSLSKIYGTDGMETAALRDINFSIKKGEFVSIMGPSGSGKSTLLHILGFLDRSTHGTYRFNGKTIDDFSDDELAHLRNKELGFVFQSFFLLSRTNVLENVKLPLIYSEVPESEWENRALKAIEAVGLSHRLFHESEKLSGGERQRVAIARALVNEPSVIFADEPTGNLDSKSGQMVMDTIQSLNQEKGITIILITHETSTAEHAERIIKVKDGTVESDEPVIERRWAKEKFDK